MDFIKKEWFKIGILLIGIIIILILCLTNKNNLIYEQSLEALVENKNESEIKTTYDLNLERKCFYWTVYSPVLNAWRWRAEHLNEYFPTREDAVTNCLVTFGATE